MGGTHWTIEDYLQRLTDPRPVPAGGVVAAVTLAQSAALLAKIAGITGGQDATRASALHVRDRATALIDEDMAAFDAVTAAAGPPRDERRTAAVTDALLTAAGPPAEIVGLGAEIIELAEHLAAAASRSTAPDVAAAVETAAAAVALSRTNVEANIRPADDRAGDLRAGLEQVDDLLSRAAAVRERVRGRVR